MSQDIKDAHPIKNWIQTTFPHWPVHRYDTVSKIINECLNLFTKEITPLPVAESESQKRFIDFNVLAEHAFARNPCFPVDFVLETRHPKKEK